MRQDTDGFSLVEVILLIGVVVVLGVVGWTVKSRGPQTNAKPYAGATKVYTDPARVYQVRYPAKWTIDQRPVSDGKTGPKNVDQNEPNFLPNDGTKLPCNASNGCGNNVNGISVSAMKVASANEVLKDGWYPVKNETINGYPAYFKQQTGDDAVWDDYFVFHNGVLLDFSFSPKVNTGMNGSLVDTQHTDAYLALVHTVKFLN